MWELDYKESWAPKNWCFWVEVLEKTLESPLDCKEIKPIHPKGNQSWIVIGRTDAEAENVNTLATWWEELTHLKIPWFLERLKALISHASRIMLKGEGDDRRWVGWMASPTQWTWVWVGSKSWGWTRRPGCSSWGHKEWDMIEQLNWTEPKVNYFLCVLRYLSLQKFIFYSED